MSPKSRRTLVSWSSGKDSAWALQVLRQDPEIQIVGLYTVVNATYQRVAMHAVRLQLLQLQAESIGLPLRVIGIPDSCSDERYASVMRLFVEEAVSQDIQCMAFGDLFLQDIRRYREAHLSGSGIAPLFPLWGRGVQDLADEMLSSGLRAFITCVDPRKLSRHYAGREWSDALLRELPATVDRCGENGEFHTVAVDGPMFRWPIKVQVRDPVTRGGFIFADVVPDTTNEKEGMGWI
ncbi:MAG: adenine nucleotide alpha hydrolase [Candidatus Aureabacteria bacterium]|nr:adenine nucleotide alpha hydrolase [Candidatus Auribacterota bacterium]